jgi:hypothetical protein
MTEESKISHIMSELGLDPADAKNRKIIERLIKAKPDALVNAQFIANLRSEISDQANAALPRQWSSETNPVTNLISNFMNKVLASALAVMVVLAAGGLWYIQNRTDQPLFQSSQSEAGQLLSGKYAVTGVEEESFGNLDRVSIVNTSEKRSASSPKGSGGTGGAPAMSEDARMIAPGEPYPAEFTFKYEGEELTDLDNTQSVLKRSKPVQPESLVSRILNLLSFGLVDLGKFQDMKLQYFAFMEDRDMGYSMNVDMNVGSVSINQNWERWPMPTYDACVNDYCGPQPRITEEDLPEDTEVFKATDNFLTEYAISKEAYGKPEIIHNQWRIMYEQLPAAEKASYYFPEQITVVYPLILEKQKVLDESGNPSGLNVTYDIRHKKVTSVYDLTTKQFERSEYKGVTDAAKIIKVAEAGGFRNYSGQANANSKVLKLGTPTKQLVKMWYQDNAMSYPSHYSPGNEIYVPALVFPIKDWQKQNYWRSSIIVPLVADVLNSDPIPSEKPIPVDPGRGDGNSAGATEPAILPQEQNR